MTTKTIALGVGLGVAIVAGACSSTVADPTPSTTAAAPAAITNPAAPAGFAPLNPEVGFGLLRVMTLEERPGPRDVVIYPALPNEMPRVAGVITTVPQTPLSHVNLRAVQDNVPNAFVANAFDDPAITALVGRYVKYTVTTEGFTIAPATQSEVEAHHAAARPTAAQTPERDLTVRVIAPLGAIGFDDWKAYGVKAANVATLATLDLPAATVPDGYAVPFSFYDEFMKTNGFYDRVTTMLADPQFRSDPSVQEQQLERLRDAIKGAPMPTWIMAALDTLQQSFPAGTSIRCRSSSTPCRRRGAARRDAQRTRPDRRGVHRRRSPSTRPR